MVRDALMRVTETWNREGTMEAIWSSIPPQARICPGSPGVQLYTTLGDKEKHHSRWHWGASLPFTSAASDIIPCHPLKEAPSGKEKEPHPFQLSVEYHVLLRRLTPLDMNMYACV